MFGRFAKPLLVVAAFAVLFATVCPLAPTPTAVAKVKQNSAVAMQAIVLPAPVVVASLWRDAATRFAPSLHPADVLALTCVRTC